MTTTNYKHPDETGVYHSRVGTRNTPVSRLRVHRDISMASSARMRSLEMNDYFTS